MMQTELSIISPQPWRPTPYMIRGTRFLLEHANAAVLAKPGGRKTSITLAALKILFDKKMINRVLIVAPRLVCYDTWPGEMEKWLDFNGFTYAVLHEGGKDFDLIPRVQVCLINYEGLDWLLGTVKEKYQAKVRNKWTGGMVDSTRVRVTTNMKRFKSFGFNVLVIDELSKYKHQDTIRFKALKEVIHTFRYRWGLTGSPAANGLIDLFGQCWILDQGNALGKFVTHFRKEYFDEDPHTLEYALKEGAEEKIYERIAPLAFVPTEQDYEQLPEMVIQDIMIDLPDDVRRIYDELQDDLITGIKNHIIVAKNAGAAATKCRQVASGGIYVKDAPVIGQKAGAREWVNLHTEKVDALMDLFEELQHDPLLIAYDFEHDMDRLRKKFKGKNIVFACDVAPADFRRLVQRWNNGEIDGLFGHPASIGHGLNLQDAGCHVAWHTMIYDFDLYDQYNRRVLRSGNKSKRVFIHHFIARDTIDEIEAGMMKSKDHTQTSLFAGLQRLGRIRE